MANLEFVAGAIQGEIDKLVEEEQRIQNAISQLMVADGGKPRRRPSGSSSEAQTTRKSSGAGARVKRQQAKRTIAPKGQRKAELVSLAREKPGIRVSEMAKLLDGVSASQLYAVAKAAEKDGTVTKDKEGGYHVNGSGPVKEPSKEAKPKARKAKASKAKGEPVTA